MKILRLLKTNLFEKWQLQDIVYGIATENIPINARQMGLTL